MSTIFTKIIRGEIPSYKIYEDEYCFCFLSIEPHNLGHTLVVPKQEIGNILDIPDILMTHMILLSKNTLGPAIQRATSCLRIGLVVEGFGVPDHFHLHIIPLFQTGDLDAAHAYHETPENMQMIAEKIRKELT